MELFFENIFRHYVLTRSIVSDRDPHFVTSFWQALWKRLGTQLNLSTANHPETDGQSDRTNQVLEDMLRAYVSSYQDDWEEHLVTAEFAYNDSVNATKGFTPFFLMHVFVELVTQWSSDPTEINSTAMRHVVKR